ncbi:hypothetical protein PUN28_004738 [Cardiocondyla obscurior]|uniref:Secreted protein n=1 Tax=Cardiocondyla obscurior TaxID=286306 RepID=A0AAW2GH38_9HYME
MEWIQLSLRVSWLLGVWLSARESLERDGYLFLRREVSSTLYVHHRKRTVFPECQLYKERASVRVCRRVPDTCRRRCGVTVRTFENSSVDSRSRPKRLFYVLLLICHLTSRVAYR